MRKQILLLLCVLISVGIAKGVGNHIGVYYNNTSYNFSGYDGAKDSNFSLNGVGVGYSYKWSPLGLIEDDIFLYVENGLILNFNFGNPVNENERGNSYKVDMQDLNLQYPINVGYIFDVYDGMFFISPYAGINLKYHFLTRSRSKYVGENGDNETGEWINFYSKDDMGADGKWKRFQVGWQAGLEFSFEFPIYLRVEYGTDFIPNYSRKHDGYKEKVNTGNLKVGLGFYF